IEIKPEAERVHLAVSTNTSTVAVGAVVVALTLPAVQAAREAARRNASMNNLKQIAIALLNHHDTYKRFPAPSIKDKEGNPLLSWRVKILPFIDENELYKEFHLDEPWDSDHNKKLIARMPKVYASPNAPNQNGTTVYLGVAGAGNFFGTPNELSIRNIIDG